MKMCFLIVEHVLNSLGHGILKYLKQILCEEMLELLDQVQNKASFVYQFKNMWSNNGDQLSIFYQGTSI